MTMTACRMKYDQYKQHYGDCGTIVGSYDPNTKTIIVLVPDGHAEPADARGQCLSTYWLKVGSAAGQLFEQGFVATSREDAIRRAQEWFAVVSTD